MDMPLSTFEIKASGMTFTAIAAGPEDGPLLICLHGFPQFADSWSQLLPQFAQAGFRAVAFDQRGYSEGARPETIAAYRIPELVQDILAVADSLKAKRFHVVGHDWGGFIAWFLAAAAPERVLSLTSVSTPHPSAYKHALYTDWGQRRRSLYLILFRMPFHVAEAVLRFNNWKIFRALYQGHVPGPVVEANIRRLRSNRGLTSILNWYRAHGGEPGPSEVPTLYIWGSQDIALSRKAAEKTRDFVRGPYQFEILEGASHWLLDEHPQRVGELICQHLSKKTEKSED